MKKILTFLHFFEIMKTSLHKDEANNQGKTIT